MANERYGRAIGFVSGGIGDQIYHLSQLRALAEASEDHKIDVACLHPNTMRTVLKNCEWCGEIIDLAVFRRDPFLWRHPRVRNYLKSRRYKTAFILHKSTNFKIIALRLGIERRVGVFGHNIDRLLLTDVLDDSGGDARREVWGHRPYIASVDLWIEEQGLRLDYVTPAIQPAKELDKEFEECLSVRPRPFIILNLFTRDPERLWPIGHAVACIQETMHAVGGTYILNAGPDASDYFRSFLSAAPAQADHIINCLAMNPTLDNDVALYHAADLYLGVDSFTANLAFNCGLPSVVLFKNARFTLRYREDTTALYPGDGQPIDSISPDTVVEAVASRLQRST